MRFSASIILSGLLATALAAPTPKTKTTAAAAAAGASTLTVRSYADFQVSDGVAGNALAEVQAKFPVCSLSHSHFHNANSNPPQTPADLAAVSDADHQIIKDARQTAEAAETDAFNPAIDAASGAAATALQNGKIKNKVLKLALEVMDLQISQAQGADNQGKIDEEQKKLDNNIATDKKNAGQASQSVAFNG